MHGPDPMHLHNLFPPACRCIRRPFDSPSSGAVSWCIYYNLPDTSRQGKSSLFPEKSIDMHLVKEYNNFVSRHAASFLCQQVRGQDQPLQRLENAAAGRSGADHCCHGPRCRPERAQPIQLAGETVGMNPADPRGASCLWFACIPEEALRLSVSPQA